jgi:hypothetical protein
MRCACSQYTQPPLPLPHHFVSCVAVTLGVALNTISMHELTNRHNPLSPRAYFVTSWVCTKRLFHQTLLHLPNESCSTVPMSATGLTTHRSDPFHARDSSPGPTPCRRGARWLQCSATPLVFYEPTDYYACRITGSQSRIPTGHQRFNRMPIAQASAARLSPIGFQGAWSTAIPVASKRVVRTAAEQAA